MKDDTSNWGLAAGLWCLGGVVVAIVLVFLRSAILPPLPLWADALIVAGLAIPWLWGIAWLMAKAQII